MKVFKRNKEKKATASFTNKLTIVMILATLVVTYSVSAMISTIASGKSITNPISSTSYTVQNQDDLISSLVVKADNHTDVKKVSYPEVHVTARIEKPSVISVLAKYLPEILSAFAVLIVSWLLSRIIGRVEDGRGISDATFADLRKISLIVATCIASVSFIFPIQAIIFGSQEGFIEAKKFTGGYNLAWLVAGLIISSVGELAVRVGKEALTLKEEVDGTV